MTIRESFENLALADIEAFVADGGREEDLHLDFKRGDPGLSKDDRRNFARAVSGFANSDGGLIVWGVDCRKNADDIDCASKILGVLEHKKFLSKLNEFTGSVVNPTLVGVEHKAITVDAATTVVVTFVPTSDSGPHMAKMGEDRYYRRSGSNFVKMEHFEIADMFGRRPQPDLVLEYKTYSPQMLGSREKSRIDLGIANRGRGSARAPYLGLRPELPFLVSHYGIDGNQHHGLPKLARAHDGLSRFGGSGDIFIHPGTIHPVTALTAETQPGAPIDIVLEYEICAADQPLKKGRLEISRKELVQEDEWKVHH